MKLPCCIFAGFECVSVQVRVRGARSDQVPCTRSVCVCVRAAAREGTGTGTVAWRGSGHGGGGGAEEPSPGEHARPYQPVDASAGFKSLLHSPAHAPCWWSLRKSPSSMQQKNAFSNPSSKASSNYDHHNHGSSLNAILSARDLFRGRTSLMASFKALSLTKLVTLAGEHADALGWDRGGRAGARHRRL